MATLQSVLQVAGIGIGATIFMDLWVALLHKLGGAPVNFDMVGRWVGHLFRGKLRHTTIRNSTPIPGERAWGWVTHYATGMAFSGLLVAIAGRGWLQHPSILPALAVGLGTVVAPLLIMQPAMGSGIASSRTPTPLRNSLRSLGNHAVFGLGLYTSASVFALVH